MNNLDKWMQYTDGLPSPNNFIKWSYRFAIAAALQRRVWLPPEHDRVFPNMYVTLVGDPGVGKGGPIRAVSSLLTEHKLEDALANTQITGDQLTVAKAMLDKEISAAQEDLKKASGGKADNLVEKPSLISVAADAVTYQALLQSMSTCYRYVPYHITDSEGKQKMQIYGHSSQCFCLEEKASLFQKHTNDLINFLIQAWDCGESYEYRTKHQGRDRILRICVNMLSGTTPDFMQSTFDDALVNQGYSARTLFIYGAKNRKSVFIRPELTEQQKQYRKELGQHIKKLTTLYGQVRVDQSTMKFLQEWLQKDFDNPQHRSAKSPKMLPYYARKNLHTMKTAAAIHFGESTEMFIPQRCFEQAIEELHEEEKTMQLALMVGGDNPLSKISTKVWEFLSTTGKKTFNEIHAQFWEKTDKKGIQEIMEFLQATAKVRTTTENDEKLGIAHVYYHATKD